MNYIPNIKIIVFCFSLLFILANSLHSSQFIDWKQVVVATNLPANSAVVPSMAKTSEGQIGIVFQSQKQSVGDFVLNFVMENSDNNFSNPQIISPFGNGYISSLTFNNTQALLAARSKTSGAIFFCQDCKPVSYIISTQILHKIDDRIFGTFMERPSWHGEIGIEAAVIPGTHNLQPKVVEKLQEMKIPVTRFPGGTDIDYTDWTDMIDNVPGRIPPQRPVTIGHLGGAVSNLFGYDEFYKLSTNLGCEVILPVNFGDAVLGKKPLSDAALHAAALVAYCNAPVGATLPAGMENWPAVRATNGFSQPFNFEYFQIGNETWFFSGSLTVSQYAQYVKVYVEKMKEVDPKIKIIVDAYSASHVTELKNALGTDINYIVQHDYLPWNINNGNLEKNGVPWTVAKLSEEDIWYAWVGTPNSFNSAGESMIEGIAVTEGRSQNYKVAITEWNFNGWWEEPNPSLDSFWARGLGAMGYLHALMRAGDVVDIACQSMTVGKNWSINAIRVSQDQAFDPYFMPSGQSVMLYSKYHGNNFLAMVGENIPTYKQPFKMNDLEPSEKVAVVDALVTENSSNIFFHVINRHFSKDILWTVVITNNK